MKKVQLYEKIVQLKMKSSDGKMYTTDAADIQGIFRIIQSIPSPKAEPFKMWLAEVGKERKEIERETGEPVLTTKNAIDFGKLIDDIAKKVKEEDDKED